MEHYQLADIKTIEANLFSDIQLEENVVHMKVQSHSRMQNLLGFALNKIKARRLFPLHMYDSTRDTQGSTSYLSTSAQIYIDYITDSYYILILQGDEVTQIIWSGEGLATQKAISCADVMKRKNKVTKHIVCYNSSPIHALVP